MHLLTIFTDVRLEDFSVMVKFLYDAAHKDRVLKLSCYIKIHVQE